jgi:hypothetical protein
MALRPASCCSCVLLLRGPSHSICAADIPQMTCSPHNMLVCCCYCCHLLLLLCTVSTTRQPHLSATAYRLQVRMTACQPAAHKAKATSAYKALSKSSLPLHAPCCCCDSSTTQQPAGPRLLPLCLPCPAVLPTLLPAESPVLHVCRLTAHTAPLPWAGRGSAHWPVLMQVQSSACPPAAAHSSMTQHSTAQQSGWLCSTRL